MENIFNKYDIINTTAVRWLKAFADKNNKLLCIKNFDKDNILNLWMLEMLKHYSLFNEYCNYYIQSNFFLYFYFRFIKKNKHLRYYSKNKNVIFIDAIEFAKELAVSCNEEIYTIIKGYDTYYGGNK